MDKVATRSKPQFISIKISSWVDLGFCLLAQAAGQQNKRFSSFGEEQNRVNKGNFRLTSVAHELLCFRTIFSIAPVNNSNASVVLFDIETLHTLVAHAINVFVTTNVIFPSQR